MTEEKFFRLGKHSINKNQIQYLIIYDDFSNINNWTGIEIFFINNKISVKIETTQALEDLKNILKNEGLI